MIQGQDYSDFVDVRPKAAKFEEKRFVRLSSIGSVPGVPCSSSPELLSSIVRGYGANQRVDCKIVVTSVVVRFHIYNEAEVLSSPQTFVSGRVALVADTMFRSPVLPPFNTDLNETLVWYLDGGDWTHTCENIERSGDRFVVLATEPFKLKPSVVPYQSTSEVQVPEVATTVPEHTSLPRFEMVTTAKIIDNQSGAYESIVGGGLWDPETRSYLNVGGHYNLDVPQLDGVSGAVYYPSVNVANTTYVGVPVNPFVPAVQTEFVPGGVIGPCLPPGFGRIYDDPVVTGYGRDALADNLDRTMVSGGLTFPYYRHREHSYTSSPYSTAALSVNSNFYCTGDDQFIDVEFDFDGGLPVAFNFDLEAYEAPDTGLFVAYTAVDGPFTVKAAYQSVIYFYDADDWALSHPVGDDDPVDPVDDVDEISSVSRKTGRSMDYMDRAEFGPARRRRVDIFKGSVKRRRQFRDDSGRISKFRL